MDRKLLWKNKFFFSKLASCDGSINAMMDSLDRLRNAMVSQNDLLRESMA
jgi:hypothetical protein